MSIDCEYLTDDALTDRVRVLQRRRGHRYSADDVATAFVAIHAAPQARCALDLGCGIGSVLLMVADRLADVHAVGIEAQTVSFDLACRNIARNRMHDRVRAYCGDLREPASLRCSARQVPGFDVVGSGFDLVTGTPPYQPIGTATPSPDAQRAHARIELRGGVEAYLAAAAGVLGSGGRFVMCAQVGQQSRVAAAAKVAGLCALGRLDVVPRAQHKASLFSVHVFGREVGAAASGWTLTALQGCAGYRRLRPGLEQLWLRDESGARTGAERALRAFFGLRGHHAGPAASPGAAAALAGGVR